MGKGMEVLRWEHCFTSKTTDKGYPDNKNRYWKGGTVKVNDNIISIFGAAKALGKLELAIRAEENSELLLVNVPI